MIQIPFNFTPRDYQLAFLSQLEDQLDNNGNIIQPGKKRGFMRWHRRAGKDKTCWAYMVKEAVKIAGNYFYVFPTAKLGREALWENVDKDGFRTLHHLPSVADMPNGKPFQIIIGVNNQEMLLRLYNGSTIRILGADHDPNSLRGVAARGVVFSEFAFQDPAAYKVLMPSVREANGWAIFNSTPSGRNHFYHFENRIAGSKNWSFSVLQTLWPEKENYSGLQSEQDIQETQLEEGLTNEDIEREFGVSYATGMKGSFYADHIEKARAEGRVGSFPYEDHKYVDTFWDIGVDDSTAVWFRQVDGRRVIWIDYFEDAGKDAAFYVKMLKERGYDYRTHYLPHDAGHRNWVLGSKLTPSTAFEMLCKEAGISDDVIVNPRAPNLQGEINSVRARFSRYYFNDGLDSVREGIEKLGLYHRRWDTKRQVFLKDPVHDGSSHCADAIRQEATAEEFGDDGFEDEMDYYRQCNTEFNVLE